MDVKLDRREILPLMREHFKSLDPKISSDELHGFLDAQTGLTTPLNEENGTAFDRWRQALAAQGKPAWNVTPERVAEVKRRGAELKKLEDDRVKALPQLLKDFAKEAPGTPLVNP